VNRDLILLYWDIGRAIDEKQQILGWGESVIGDGRPRFAGGVPRSTGFSPRNLRRHETFYLAYTDEAIWRQQIVRELTHNWESRRPNLSGENRSQLSATACCRNTLGSQC
jgi:hypothetical protein